MIVGTDVSSPGAGAGAGVPVSKSKKRPRHPSGIAPGVGRSSLHGYPLSAWSV